MPKKNIARQKAYPVIEGYFSIINPQDRESELEEWKKWFDHKGIKHKTVLYKGMYMLYREGEERI